MRLRAEGAADKFGEGATEVLKPPRHETDWEKRRENRKRAKARANLEDLAAKRFPEDEARQAAWFREIVNYLGLTVNRDYQGVGR